MTHNNDSRRPATRSIDTAAFRRAIRRHPHQIGAVAQTGPRLAARAADLIPDIDAQFVVELGPGAGAVSDAIHHRLPASGAFLAVEVNTAMVEHLTATRPWLYVIQGDAEDLPKILAKINIGQPDLVVSALPWSLWDTDRQTSVLDAITEAMAPGATFATIATISSLPTPAAARFRRLLRDRFTTVYAQRLIWRNTPPARWYVARGHPNT